MLPDGCGPDRSPDLVRLIIGTRTPRLIITYVMFGKGKSSGTAKPGAIHNLFLTTVDFGPAGPKGRRPAIAGTAHLLVYGK
jgi:hypothetical protein